MQTPKTPVQTSSLLRRIEAISREQRNVPDMALKTIDLCFIVGIKGPPDASDEPENSQEQYGIWAVIELPDYLGNERITVRFGYTNHELYNIYGNASSLIGKLCRVTYRGSGQAAIAAGRVYIIEDRFSEEEDSRLVTTQADACGAMTGNMTRGSKDPGFAKSVFEIFDKKVRKGSAY